jgi:hypothetical protein
MQEVALPRIERYAARHGYDVVVGDGTNREGRPASWSKVILLQRQLARYEACLWMDADLLIVDDSLDVGAEVPPAAAQAVACHSAPHCGTVPNFGLWFVRAQALPFLDLVWELEVFWDHVWWEQAAALVLLGYAGLERNYITHLRETKWKKSLHFLRKCWNSHPLDADPAPRIVHCASPLAFEERLTMMREWEAKCAR